jgi:hypothetical protein
VILGRGRVCSKKEEEEEEDRRKDNGSSKAKFISCDIIICANR